MNPLKMHWKAIAAAGLVIITFSLLILLYLPQRAVYKNECAALIAEISALQDKIMQNQQYAEYQNMIPAALDDLQKSRLELYYKFPAEFPEENQLMYAVYLEELFGTEIHFEFGTASVLQTLSDGAVLSGLSLTVNYETTYEGFQNMINYLATDSRITSIQYATMEYDQQANTVSGELTLLCYTLQSDDVQRETADIDLPNSGKSNIFE